ncbi:MAG: DUF4350 domain-containing protein [Planctomycetota bacterium]|jgi:hypothetical protein
MLTPRNVISLTIAIAVFSLVWTVIGMLQLPGSNDLRSDSYGTRYHGHKAAVETLDELGVEVERRSGPPASDDLTDSVLVFWQPHLSLVASEPSWLRDLQDAVRAGGHVVIGDDGGTMFPSGLGATGNKSAPKQLMVPNPDESIVELLGVHTVSIEQDDAQPPQPADDDDISELLADRWAGLEQRTPRLTYAVRATGDFDVAAVELNSVELPVGQLDSIQSAGEEFESAMYVIDDAGNEHCIVARVSVGDGSVTIVSTPWILSNGGIGQADNVMVAALALLHGDRRIVFDEFYHGLAVRGNPVWLFSQRTYGTVTLALLGLTAVVIWQGAVFLGPPLSSVTVSRRSIREYVDAMSRFMCEGRFHDQWMLGELRDGVLWQLRQEHGLPPEQHSVEELLTMMARRDAGRAETLRGVLTDVDRAVSGKERTGQLNTIQLLQRMRDCLSRNSTARSAVKSAK